VPGFDRASFDELRNLDAVMVQSLPREAFVPHLHEAQFAGAVSNSFVQLVMALFNGGRIVAEAILYPRVCLN
jgi:hypothetical protein